MLFSTLVPILCLFWNNTKPLDVISFLCKGLGWCFWTVFFSFDTISVSHKFVFSADLSLSFTGFFFLSTWLIPITVMNSHCVWMVPGALAIFCPNKHFCSGASAPELPLLQLFQLLGWRIPYKSTHAYSSPRTLLTCCFISSWMWLTRNDRILPDVRMFLCMGNGCYLCQQREKEQKESKSHPTTQEKSRIARRLRNKNICLYSQYKIWESNKWTNFAKQILYI